MGKVRAKIAMKKQMSVALLGVCLLVVLLSQIGMSQKEKAAWLENQSSTEISKHQSGDNFNREVAVKLRLIRGHHRKSNPSSEEDEDPQTNDEESFRASIARLESQDRQVLMTATRRALNNAAGVKRRFDSASSKQKTETVKQEKRETLKELTYLDQTRMVKAEKRLIQKREAGAEGTSQPEIEPSAENVFGTAEADTNATSEPKQDFVLWPEPEPEWDTARNEWKAAWPLHVYGFATIFIGISIVCVLELARIHMKSRRKTALKVSLLVMIFLFGITRAIALCVNPYGSTNNMDATVTRIIFSIGHPCIISAMSLLLLVLIDTTKMNVAPPTFQRVQFIVIVVVVHVVLVLLTDIVVAYYAESKILILVCQIYYLVLGTSLTFGYARVGWKISRNASANVTRDRKMQKLKILITIAAVTGALIVAVTIYGAAGVFGIYSDVQIVEAWPWWGFQTALRILEVAMVGVLLIMNISVAGAGYSCRTMLRYCRKKFANKVQDMSVVPSVNSASWTQT